MAHVRSPHCGGPATKGALRVCAFALSLPMALSLSAAEQAGVPRNDHLALQKAYADAVRARIVEHWLRPASVLPGQQCSARVLQLPTGTVISVETQSDCQFDAVGRSSLEDAVRRAQPLPTEGFQSVYARHLQLTFVAE
ncbi:TonB C-terminal domain-containing protein [Stenotrophomonas indicatrix]|uniref:TonB C-terminal domain-containing protein n=1 Tax=Stenotrophomonas indicatrix TaxID=2045451 RepID=UPI0009B2586D|nr:TonB C-terminal domain-containing protein [Stenotrophomonas indicatrix]